MRMKWETVEIDKIIEKPISGEWGKEPELNDSYVYVIRSTNFSHNGHINLNKGVAKRKIDDKKVEKKKLVYGDIIIEKSGGSPKQPVGRVIFFNVKDDTFLCSNFTSVLRAKDTVHSKYLHYLLFAHHQFKTTLSFQNKTTGIINLQLSRYLKKAKIPLPPLPIQKKIAAILDAADNYRQKTKALIDKYDQLTQSIFLDMFGDPVRNEKGWEVKKLQTLGNLKSGGTPSRKKPEYFSGFIPWVTTVNLNKRLILKEDASEYITDTAIKESSTKLIPKGSIMIGTRVGVGKASINGVDMCSNQDILSLVGLNKCIHPDFFLSVLEFYKEYFNSQKRGATIQGISSKIIKNIEIIIPPIKEQNMYFEKIDICSNSTELINNSIQNSENLFQSLLQKAFKGELVN